MRDRSTRRRVTACVVAVVLASTACVGEADEPAEPAAPPEEPTEPADAEPTEPATIDVGVFFANDQLGDPCEEVFPVTRSVAADDPIAGALEALLAGPTEPESADGYGGWFSEDTAGMLRGVAIRDGTALVDLDDLRPVIPGASSSCGSALLLAQLDRTLLAFEEVEDTRYSLLGDTDAFYEWLQYEAPADAAGVTLEQIAARLEQQLDALGRAQDPDDPFVRHIACMESGVMTRGDVVVCDLSAEGPYEVESGALTIVALDDQGHIAWQGASDSPGSTAQLRVAYGQVPHGLTCRELLDGGAGPGIPFDLTGTTPSTQYFWSLVYWFLEGQPARMDADGDGIPCETLYPDSVTGPVLAGEYTH